MAHWQKHWHVWLLLVIQSELLQRVCSLNIIAERLSRQEQSSRTESESHIIPEQRDSDKALFGWQRDGSEVKNSFFGTGNAMSLGRGAHCSDQSYVDAFIEFANSNSPRESIAWIRSKNLLDCAKKGRAILLFPFFLGVKARLCRMLEAFGAECVVYSEPEAAFLADYRPGIDVVFELSYFAVISKDLSTTGYLAINQTQPKDHKRVILQSEQLNGRFGEKVSEILVKLIC